MTCAFSLSAGECWYHVPSPTKQKLKQVSVGRTSVFAVDENGEEFLFMVTVHVIIFFDTTTSNPMPDLFWPGNLWYRKGLTPSYPQGSSWEYVSNNVRKVTVGPFDQVGISIAQKSILSLFS